MLDLFKMFYCVYFMFWVCIEILCVATSLWPILFCVCFDVNIRMFYNYTMCFDGNMIMRMFLQLHYMGTTSGDCMTFTVLVVATV